MNEQLYHKPPKLALKVFRWYCRPDRLEELEGDLEEFFMRRLADGSPPWKAKLFFWWNILHCYRSYAKKKTQNNILMFSLYKSYLKLGLRHSWKNRWPVAINVVGLGLALSLCLFLYIIYAFNFEFDTFYKDTDNIYRIHGITQDGEFEARNELSPIAMDDKLRNEIGGIEAVGTFMTRTLTVKHGTDFFNEYTGIVSADFQELFPLPLRYGSWSGFGENPQVYLTQDLAEKYFGDEYAVGKELTVYVSSEDKMLATVGGVFDKIPINSSFDFELLINKDDFFRGRGLDQNDWSSAYFVGHYIKTTSNQLKSIEAQINSYVTHQNDEYEPFQIKRFELIPFMSPLIADDQLSGRYITARLRPQVFIIFTVLIAMVFLTACFNLANTSMAMIARRLKEIGIRKTLGSESRQILIQYLFEMGIICFLAFIIALSTANFTSRSILGLFFANFLLQDVNLTGVILFVAIFLVFTTLVAGLLPGLYAWRFQPVQIMRKSVKLRGVNWLNKALIVAQYSFSIAVMVAGLTFSRNADFLEDVHLGYQDEEILDLRIENEHFVPLRQQINQIPGVVTAGAINHLGSAGRYAGRGTLKIDTATHRIDYYAVGENYLDLMEVNIKSGRGFISGSQADLQSILVNQEFVNRHFLNQDPINQVVKIDEERKLIVGIIPNILDDVYEDSQVKPTVIGLSSEGHFRHLMVKATAGNIQAVEKQVKRIWSEIIDQPYEGILQKDLALGTAGRDTQNLQKIFIAVAILSGFLSIAGIFSLAKLNIAKRLKEITIRKVLGASLSEILLSINKSFSIVLFIALLVGCGLGFFISDAVLGLIYKVHVDVSLVGSLLSGLIIVIISWFMLSGVAVGPANSNPVSGLRED